MAKAKKPERVAIPEGAQSFTLPPDAERTVIIDIVGCEEGMLQNQLTLKAKSDIQNGKDPTNKRTRKEVTQESRANWESSAHFACDGRRGHPAEAFLKAMGSAVGMVSLSAGPKQTNKPTVQRCITVRANAMSKEGLPLVCFSSDTKANSSLKVEPAEHWAINKKVKVPVPVYRTHILGGWKMSVPISFDSSVLSPQDIIVLMQKAGSNVGIGAWRKEAGGVFGRFKVTGANLKGVD